jgi:hypothetical protein
MKSICNTDITFKRAHTHEIDGGTNFHEKSAYNRGPRSIEARSIWLYNHGKSRTCYLYNELLDVNHYELSVKMCWYLAKWNLSNTCYTIELIVSHITSFIVKPV